MTDKPSDRKVSVKHETIVYRGETFTGPVATYRCVKCDQPKVKKPNTRGRAPLYCDECQDTPIDRTPKPEAPENPAPTPEDPTPEADPNVSAVVEYVKYVQAVRRGVEMVGNTSLVVTPRQINRGAAMIKSGLFSREEIEWTQLWASQSPDAVRAICAAAGLPSPRLLRKPRRKGVVKTHYRQDLMFRLLDAGHHVLVVGPSGTGKSWVAGEYGRLRNRAVLTKSCHSMMTEEALNGFMSAHGDYVIGLMRDASEHGKILLLDEVDASNPEILTAMQAISALGPGEEYTFPDGAQVKIHPDFRIIAGGNTWGDGADAVYSSRQQLDGAFPTRFSMIDFPYDEELEVTLALMAADLEPMPV